LGGKIVLANSGRMLMTAGRHASKVALRLKPEADGRERDMNMNLMEFARPFVQQCNEELRREVHASRLRKLLRTPREVDVYRPAKGKRFFGAVRAVLPMRWSLK
jgi:hypothetical protein